MTTWVEYRRPDWKRVVGLAVVVLLCGIQEPRAEDEEMWTFDNLPLRQLQERYGFSPTPEWLERVPVWPVSASKAEGPAPSSARTAW